MSKYYGDFTAGQTVRIPFNTNSAAGAPITLAGTPVAKAYKDGSTSTEVATGVSLSVDFDGLTGSHVVTVDLAADGTFYAAGSDFAIRLTAGTVDGVSVVGVVLGAFSVENRTQKADVRKVAGQTASAAGAVTFPSAIGTSTYAGGAVASVTGSVGSVTGAVGSVTGNVGGNVNGNVVGSTASVSGAVGSVTGSVGSVAGDVGGKVIGGGSGTITGDGVRASSVTGAVGSVTGATGSVTGAVGSVSGNIGGDVAGKVIGGGSGTLTGDGVRAASVTGAVGSVTGSVGSVTAGVAVSDKTGFKLASDGLDSIAVTAPSGVATTFPGMVVQTWRRFFRKATRTATELKTYADNGSTVVTTQAVTDDGAGNETMGAAS